VLEITASRSTSADLSNRWKVDGGSRREVSHGWVRVLTGMWLNGRDCIPASAETSQLHRLRKVASSCGCHMVGCEIRPTLVSTTTTQDYCDFTTPSTQISYPFTDSTAHPCWKLGPAITDGIFPAHSGCEPLRSVSCFTGSIVGFVFRDHSHRLVVGQLRMSLFLGSTIPDSF